MELKKAIGLAIKRARKRSGLSQEAFSIVSSRTYLSTLERGLKNPTVEKVHEIAIAMGMHPLSILFDGYLLHDDSLSANDLFLRIRGELEL